MNDQQPSAQPALPPILDCSMVDEFIEGVGANADGSLFADFLTETERRLDVLSGLTCEDRAAIRFQAHTLLGSAGTFGMMRLSQLARALERAAATITPENYRAAVDHLIAVFRTSRDELVAYLKQAGVGRQESGQASGQASGQGN